MASRTAAILEKRRLDSRTIERLRRRRGAVMGMPLWKRPSEVHVYVSAKLMHHLRAHVCINIEAIIAWLSDTTSHLLPIIS